MPRPHSTRLLLIRSVLFLPFTFAFAADQENQAVEIFISPTGNDRNQGTSEHPFKSPERARDAVREMKKTGKQPAGGVIIQLRGGDYIRTKSLEFSAEDSGTKNAPIIWQAYENEKVRFLGGQIITGFKSVRNKAILSRLNPEARDKVLTANLKTLDIRDYGTLKSRGFGRPTVPAHGELFFGGLPMTLAQWPNPGQWEHIAGFPKETALDDGHGTIIGSLPAGFYYESERPKGWINDGNIWIHGYWAYDWANSYERIAELDPERGFIRTIAPYGHYGYAKGQRICFINILEELDQPGEWFIDQKSGKLYFWPPLPIGSGEVLLSMMEQPFIRIKETNHLIFKNIEFEATRGTAIEISGGEGNLVTGCKIRNTGNWGVILSEGTGNGVQSCDILDTGDGGVSMTGGDRQTLTPGNHFVENCHFQRQGRWSKCYVPAVLMTGVGLRVSHNLIHDHPHCAILFTGNDHLIEYNEIHHIALETGDVGAIYTGRDYTFRGNRIIYNYIHETGGVGMGSMGVYMDDCVSGTEVYGNIFYKVHWAMFIGGGRDHRVENNLFVDCDPAIRADGRGLDPKPVWRNMVDVTMRERINEVPAALFRNRYPALKDLDAYYGAPGAAPVKGEDFKGIPPEGNIIERNICFGRWKEIAWFADEKLFSIRDNFITSDTSLIGNPESGFRLAEDSPAWKTGFKAISFERIGLLK